MDFIMFTVIPILLTAMMAVLLFILGTMSSQSAISRGRSGVFTAGTITGLFAGALLGFFVWFLANMDYHWRPHAMTVAYACAAVSFLICFAPALFTLLTGKQTAEYLRQIAPTVKEIGLASFAEADQDGDGTLTTKELALALEKLGVDPKDRRRILKHIHEEISEVGHVIDSYTTTGFIFIANPKGGGIMVPTTTTHYVYGVSRSDLESYPDRIIQKYRHW